MLIFLSIVFDDFDCGPLVIYCGIIGLALTATHPTEMIFHSVPQMHFVVTGDGGFPRRVSTPQSQVSMMFSES